MENSGKLRLKEKEKVAETGGNEKVTLSESQMPSHNHGGQTSAGTHNTTYESNYHIHTGYSGYSNFYNSGQGTGVG